MLVFTSFLTAVFALQNGVFSQAIDYPAGVWTMYLSTIAFILIPLLARWGVKSDWLAHAFIGVVFVDLIFLYRFGGAFTSVTAPYVTIVPLMGILLLNRRAGLFWLVMVALMISAFGVALSQDFVFERPFNDTINAWFKLSAYVGVVVIIYFITRTFDLARDRAMGEVEEKNILLDLSRQRSDDLLLNILPEETANELKEKGKAQARAFESVTIMFTDFVGFTKVAEQLEPAELVSLIDEYFSEFDRIVSTYKLEKIKTIGDAYMVAGGLPIVRMDHALRVVAAAQEIRDFVEDRQQTEGDNAFHIRIGIHTGPVIAGVVGSKKFAYDIWGDSVNIAARMESSGEQGRINISGTTYEQIKDHFNCEYRGKVEAKNKGAIDMYFVDGPLGEG